MEPTNQWGEQHSVHVRKFDDDHSHLFAMLTELDEAVQAGKGKAVVRRVLIGLVAFTEQHFAIEEAAMQGTGFPGYAAHVAEHRQLTRRVRELLHAYEIGDTGVALEVLHFLREWTEQHTLITDREYSAHLNAHGVR